MKAKDLMTRQVITIKEEDTIEVAARILNEKGISGLPVIPFSLSILVACLLWMRIIK